MGRWGESDVVCVAVAGGGYGPRCGRGTGSTRLGVFIPGQHGSLFGGPRGVSAPALVSDGFFSASATVFGDGFFAAAREKKKKGLYAPR